MSLLQKFSPPNFRLILSVLGLLSVSEVMADTISGPPPRQNILLLKGDEAIGLLEDALNANHNVTEVSSLPADLSPYTQVWDARFSQSQDWGTAKDYLNATETAELQQFMRDSGTVFLMGENEGFSGRNYPTLAFINSVVKSGPFAASKVSVLDNGGSSANAVLTNPAAVNAENFGTDFNDLNANGNIWTEFPGGVRLSELAGGEAVYVSSNKMDADAWKTTYSWPDSEYGAIGIAFTSAKLKPEYYSSKLFVFFDWQDTGAP